MRVKLRLLGTLGALASFPAPALAGNAVDMKAVSSAIVGQGSPSVTFTSHVDGQLQVGLSCGGKRFALKATLAPGSEHTVELPGLAKGQHACSGTVELQTADGGVGSMPLNLTVAMLPQLMLSAPEEHLDLEGHTLRLRADRPLKDVVVDVYGGDDGSRIGGGRQPGQDLSELDVAWSSEGEILRIDVTATDQSGFQSVLTLLPWSYAIPHEDVVFDSNQAAITAAEEPKLEAAWAHVKETLDKYGDIVDMELFVAGYTDTVGDAASNKALSLRRARAIAQWFRKRGFTRPIHIQGFGESALAVPTGDGVDEARNRRSLYVLAARPPARSADLPTASWQAL